MTIWSQLRTAAAVLVVFSILTGLAYPLAITGVAQVFFSSQASGSLLVQNGKVIGSELIGQSFDDPKYFWSRPSATAPFSYNAASSSGGNLALSNSAQSDAIQARVKNLRAANSAANVPAREHDLIPMDLVTASGSGLDPHISAAAAEYQTARVAAVRSLAPARVRELIAAATSPRQFGFLGEPRVNVLQLNLALDGEIGTGK